jgi:zinc transport system permease protein
MVAVTIVLLIQIVGSILVVSMLCLPAAMANIFAKKLSNMIFIAILLSMLFSTIGAGFSLWFNLPLGATIALCSAAGYLFSSLSKKFLT